jgi:DNA repair photolyase
MYFLRLFDPWKGKYCTCGAKYSLAPFTGCDHKCLYCYITTYIPQAFQCRIKSDFIKKLPRDLAKADRKIPITIANSSDPYPTLERSSNLTRETLKILTAQNFKILLVTKSDIILRDIDILTNNNVVVTVTINSIDDDLASRLEPGAPVPSKRIAAVERLVTKLVPVMVRVDPIIPGLNEAVEPLLKELANIGVKFITTSTYKARPDSIKRLSTEFPEHANHWHKLYMDNGEFINRSWYLDKGNRDRIMRNVYDAATRNGLKINMCREGLDIKRTAPSCDGAHLLNS